MKSAQQIVDRILEQIQHLYREPQFAVYTLGELEALLWQLHWQYADAIGRLDDLCRLLSSETTEKFRQWEAWRVSHCPFDLPSEAAAVIARWQTFDRSFGIAPLLQSSNSDAVT